jgi:CBS domain-containing protein
MNIADICTKNVRTCHPESDIAAAAVIMWETDCGAVPVLDDGGKLVGVVTDRDISIAVATRKNLAAETPVKDVMSGKVATCGIGDSVQGALKIMREAQIRRLPVLDENGKLRGMVSVNDIILAIRETKTKAVKEALLQEVTLTLMAISQNRRPHGMALAESRSMLPRT